MKIARLCTVPGCNKKHRSNGFCEYHRAKDYRERNPEKFAEYRIKHREYDVERMREYRAKYPEKVREAVRRSYLKHYLKGIWYDMIHRCTNPNNRSYHNYGGRGIKVCERWLNSYEAFEQDMGHRPTPKHSIDRINNDGNYEPGNCRWATWSEQARNKRKGLTRRKRRKPCEADTLPTKKSS